MKIILPLFAVVWIIAGITTLTLLAMYNHLITNVGHSFYILAVGTLLIIMGGKILYTKLLENDIADDL